MCWISKLYVIVVIVDESLDLTFNSLGLNCIASLKLREYGYEQSRVTRRTRCSTTSNIKTSNDSLVASPEILVGWLVGLMVLNATFNNISAISWRSVLLVGETGENNRPNKLSHNVVSSTPRLSEVRTHNVSGDRHWLHM